MGIYSRSISYKVEHCHWHMRAQRITLSHTGMASPGTGHLRKSGTHRHRHPHTKRLAFTQTPRRPSPPATSVRGCTRKDVCVGGRRPAGTLSRTITCGETHSPDTHTAAAEHAGVRGPTNTARSAWHTCAVTLSGAQKHTRVLNPPPILRHTGANTHSDTLRHTVIHTHLAMSGNTWRRFAPGT